MVGRHHAALLNGIVQKRQSRRGSMGTADLQAHFLQNPGDTVTHSRSGGQTQVHNTKRNTQPPRSLHAHQLAHPGDLERRLLDGFRYHIKGLSLDALKCVVHYAGTGNTHIQDALRLPYTVESAGHKGVVLHRVGEDHHLGAAKALIVRSQLRGFLNNAAHFRNRIHVDARFGRAYIDTGAHTLRGSHGLGNGANQLPVASSASFLNQGRKSADEIHSAGRCRSIQSPGNFDIRLRIAGAGHDRNGGHGDPLVDNGNSKFLFDVLPHLHQILGPCGDFLIDFCAANIQVRIAAVHQADSHSNGTDIQMALVNHIQGLQYIVPIQHNSPSNPMHGFKNVFPLDSNGQSHFFSNLFHFRHQIRQGNFAHGHFRGHHHGKIALHNRLADVQHIYIILRQCSTDAGNNPNPVLADHCYNSLHYIFSFLIRREFQTS